MKITEVVDNYFITEETNKGLYVSRKLTEKSQNDLYNWITKYTKSENLLDKSEYHITIVYSKKNIDYPLDKDNLIVDISNANVARLGEAIVLKFKSSELEKEWQIGIDNGATWDYDEYIPHISLTYKNLEDIDINKIVPYEGKLEFTEQIAEPLDENWKEKLD